MRWYYGLQFRMRSWFRKQQSEREFDNEIEFHLQRQIDEYVVQGMSADEARHAALRLIGGLAQAAEECRDIRSGNFFENLRLDLRFALRMLRRSPGVPVLAILCLTLGIGANASVCSWIEGILLKPYPAAAYQERLL